MHITERLGKYYIELKNSPADELELIASLKTGQFQCIHNGN
jgi:hypothetical protein